MGLKVKGLDKMSKKLSQAASTQPYATTVRTSGTKLYNEMRRLANPGSPVYVKGYATGATQASLSQENSGLKTIVRMNQPYNVFTEYGTRFMEPEPIIAPALENIRPQFIRDLERTMKDLLK